MNVALSRSFRKDEMCIRDRGNRFIGTFPKEDLAAKTPHQHRRDGVCIRGYQAIRSHRTRQTVRPLYDERTGHSSRSVAFVPYVLHDAPEPLMANCNSRRLFSDLLPISDVKYTIPRLMRGMLAILQRTEDRCVKYAGIGTTIPTKLLNGVKYEVVVIPI